MESVVVAGAGSSDVGGAAITIGATFEVGTGGLMLVADAGAVAGSTISEATR